MAPDQEWCLACGAAAGTEVVEAEGWRVPLYLGGGLVALAVIGVILAIVALSNQKHEVEPGATPTAVASQPPGATPTISPLPSTTAVPSVTAAPTTEGTPTVAPSVTAAPTDTATPEPTDTATPEPTTGTFPGWTGSDGDYTIIIESAKSQSGAEKVAQKAQDGGLTVGILNSSDYSNLNGGYYVVFSGDYSSKSDAQADLDGVRADFKDAYVRQIKS
jgi:septal ring-binding cell division protein DamX